jgi:hypothetical protein
MVAVYMGGIRAELVVESPDACPVADASTEVPGSLTDVRWTGGGEGPTTEQFTAPGDADVEGFEQVFDYGTSSVYEFERDRETTCVCEFVERESGPVADVETRNGAVHLTLLLSSIEALRDLLPDLRDRYGTVSLAYLVRSRETAEAEDVVPVDLGRLTDRQQEVVRTAYEMGYFEYPRGANAGTVASELDIEASTFAEHLAAAQSKLLAELLERGQA